MNKNLLRCCTYSIIALLMSGRILNAQIWKDPMANPNTNFYTIQHQFNHDMRGMMREISRDALNRQSSQQPAKGGSAQQGEESEAGMEGYLQFKRWEYFMEPRVFPSGDLSLPSTNWQRFEDYLNSNPAAMQQYQQGHGNFSAQRNSGPNTIQSNVWTFAGPTGAPTGAGAGRVGFIRIDPTNANNIWIGAPAGGLWKSTNGGASWTTNTDFLTVIGASDVVIDPTNTLNMYLATGDGDAGDTYSTGVLKSTDGGTTWNTTGLAWTPNQGRLIRKLLINPTTPTTIMAFSNVGIWRTTNGGTNWTQVQSTNGFTDAEFMPGTPNTVYACGTTFWKSTDGGATWAQITTGLPAAANVNRLAIAVTAANSAYIYMIAGSAASSGFYGFYRSTNSGTSFTQITVTSPANLLGWASNGNDAAAGGQSWYDLVIDCSPTNANEVCVGGVNIWRTTNGGTSWLLNGHWTGTGAPYVHADHHAMLYLNATTMFEGCDGGVFKTTNNGGAWLDISANLCIAQSYRIGLSASNPSYWITGHQDNGTNLKNGAAYVGTMGGDGMDCFVDRTNNNVMYGEQYQGSLNRTTNGGTTWNAITTGLTGTAPWVTPWYQDPTTANTIYCGRTLLFKSVNQGTNWAAAGALPGAGTVVDFKVAPSNNQVIYVVKSNAVYKTINGGTAWTTITGTLPVGSAAISRVDVKPTDPLVAIVTFSGYSAGNKVFKTINGGTTWTNISTGLPNLPCNCVRFDASSAIEGVYVGCDVGVYYTDNTFAGVWQPYFTSLPNVPIFDLEIYAPTLKVRASSYGRGIWEVDIYNPGTLPPVAQFVANTYITCVGSPVNFTDQSSFTPTAWTWTFPGGTPASSTVQNPAGITWATPGTYTVSLTCSNANGTSAPATRVITVLGSQAPPLVEGFQSATFLPAGWTANNINNDAMFWTLATTGAASTQSALFDNYNNDVGGARDEMWAPRLNCSAFSTLSMTFDVAYARYDATYSDSLQVLVSTDCGATWISVYLKGGTLAAGNLATAPDQTTAFIPTAAQWRNESVVLNAYAGQSSVLVIFRNRGHYGNNLYVDNINITGTASAIPNATFTASATTACVGTPINFTDASSGAPTSWTWTFPSGTPASATTQNVVGVTWATAGTYTVTHTATNASGTGTTTQVITINALPSITTTTTGGTICSGNSTTITASGGVTYSWMPGSLSGITITVSPLATTTYTVTGTNAAGCTNTATRTITVNPTPTVTVSATSTTICSGNNTTLTAAGATTYTWMPGSLTGTSVVVTPAATTTYTVTGTTAGCTSTATQLITVNPTPTVTVSASATTICAGGSSTLTASGATTYTWMPGSLTGASVVVTPATTTTYTVTGTSAGCNGTATQLITVNPSPTVTVSASSSTICNGSSTTLTASGATTYTWMPGSLTGTSVVVTPAATTTYTVTGTTAGCTGTATQLITVTPTPTVTASASSPTICNGSSTTLTASGATTYTWMPGSLTGTSVVVTPAATTTYTVTGTTAGCTGTATQLITVTPTPTVTASASSATICNGSSTTLTASGATTYTWMPGSLTGTSVVVTPTATTTYTVTGTTAGCTGTATKLITVIPSPTVTVSASSTTICAGGSTTLTASGATTYAWMPGSLTGSSVVVTPATTTTYTVTGTAVNGCSAVATQLITVNPIPTVTASASSSSICTGNSVTLTATGATTYLWMPGSLAGAVVVSTPPTTTTYTVTGTTGACSNTATVTVIVGAPPTVTASAASPSICVGSSTTLTGSGAATYTWMPGSLSGTTVTVTPAATTTYTVTGTTGPGCFNTGTVTVTVNALPSITTTTTGGTICSGSSTTITASGGVTYAWMPGSLTGTTVTVSPIVTTTYTVTGTNAAGCTSTATRTITVNPSPTVTVSASSATICVGGSTTLTGAGASTYAWMPGSLTGTSVTVTPAATTTYTVTGTAVNGCTASATQLITVTPSPTVTVSATSTTICSGTSTTLTATGATTYSWMPGSLTGTSVTVTPAASTTYTVTGTTGGCTGTATQLITVNPSPTVTTAAPGGAICSGNGKTITASGALTYTWMPGSLSGNPVTVFPATTTTYTVTGTAANGCTGTATRTVTVNPSPTVTASASSTSICAGSPVTLSATGATTYNWQPGNHNGQPWTTTPAGTTTYTVTGTAGGCTGTAQVTVTVNPVPIVTTTTTAGTICSGNSTTITASGATTYTWMPGSLSGTTVTVSPAATTTYTVTGANGGCTSTATRTITVNPSPTVTTSTTGATICSGNSTTIMASGASTYAWMPGSLSGSTITDSPGVTTTYTVTGTALNGCTDIATQLITVNASPTVTATASSITLCSGTTVTLTGSGAATYNWMPGNINGSPVTDVPLTSTTYTVTGTATGCTATATVAITVNPTPTITATISSSVICVGASITLTGSGASTYNWQPQNVSGSPVNDTPLSSVTYTLTGTDISGCANTATVSVTVNPLPAVISSVDNDSVCSGTLINLTGTGASTYIWQPINTTGAAVSDSPIASMTYTVTGTDINGCSNTDSSVVVVYSQPIITVSGNDTICNGSSTTLTASGGVSYFWPLGGQSTPMITDSPTTTTTYTVNGTDISGCSNTATIVVTVGNPPAVPTIIVNGSLLTSSVTGASYQWFLNGIPISGATSQSYTATQMGSFTVEVYDSIGCGSGQSAAVLDPTGIATVTDVDAFTVIPNPNDGHFQLNFHVTRSDNYILEIHDMLGQVVYSESLSNFKGIYNKEIDLSIYGRGMYTIRLRNSTNETVIKTLTY